MRSLALAFLVLSAAATAAPTAAAGPIEVPAVPPPLEATWCNDQNSSRGASQHCVYHATDGKPVVGTLARTYVPLIYGAVYQACGAVTIGVQAPKPCDVVLIAEIRIQLTVHTVEDAHDTVCSEWPPGPVKCPEV